MTENQVETNTEAPENKQENQSENQKEEPEIQLQKLAEHSKNKSKQNIPIFLIDVSSSTDCNIHHYTKHLTTNCITNLNKIIDYEIYVVKNKLIELNCEYCYLIFWSDREKHSNEKISVNDVDKVVAQFGKPNGNTDISVAINSIPDEWYQKNTDMYIITDGEITGNRYKFENQIFNLAKKYVNIHIITVEPNKNNYSCNNINAGSIIYSNLQTHKLTKYVRSFECYNLYHTTKPFINLYNPELLVDQFSFNKYVFSNKNFDKFFEIICQLLAKHKSDINYVNKMMYDLSFTIYTFTKNKPQSVKNEFIRLFTDLFSYDGANTNSIKNIFENEIVSHTEGVSKTYQQYRENRKILFEKTLDDLRNNVMESFQHGSKCCTFVINTSEDDVKRIIESNMANSYVKLNDTFYNNGGIHYGNHYLPVLPLSIPNPHNTNVTNKTFEQPLRQWIRSIYARIHKMQTTDERILYLFLTDTMSICLSDLPEHIKTAWINCAEVMLQADRFNSGGIKQFVFLTMGNKPKPMVSGYFTMDEILTYCMKHFNKNLNIPLDDFWYGICLALNNNHLTKSQLPPNFNSKELTNVLRSYNTMYLYENVSLEKELVYQDYITLEDISNAGGYKFPNYKYGSRTFVSNLLISHTTYNDLKMHSKKGTTKCPITGTTIKLSDFVKIPKQSKNNNSLSRHNDSDFDMKIFNKLHFQRVDLISADKMDLSTVTLFSSSQLDI